MHRSQEELPVCFCCRTQALTTDSETTAEEWAVPSAQGLLQRSVCFRKSILMEEGTDSLLEEFNLIYFLWNGYKVITFKVNRKGKCLLSHPVVRRPTDIGSRLATFFPHQSLFTRTWLCSFSFEHIQLEEGHKTGLSPSTTYLKPENQCACSTKCLSKDSLLSSLTDIEIKPT